MPDIKTLLGGLLSPFLLSEAVWAIKLDNGRFLSERDTVKDGAHPQGKRPFDWTLDLVATGDIRRVKELWLLAPPNPQFPTGQLARLAISEPYTAFQFKVGYAGFGGASVPRAHQLIGRVDDRASGACTCFVWDASQQVMGAWHSTIFQMGSWSPEVAPLGALSPTVLGLRP